MSVIGRLQPSRVLLQLDDLLDARREAETIGGAIWSFFYLGYGDIDHHHHPRICTVHIYYSP